MKKSLLSIFDIRPSGATTGAYNLVLEEVEGKRKLPIVIGMHEAQSIAIKMENMTPSRPLTHDLFSSLCQSFDIELKEVVIYDLVEGIFFARLVCGNGENEETIDARTSDAVALGGALWLPHFLRRKSAQNAGIPARRRRAGETHARGESRGSFWTGGPRGSENENFSALK